MLSSEHLEEVYGQDNALEDSEQPTEPDGRLKSTTSSRTLGAMLSSDRLQEVYGEGTEQEDAHPENALDKSEEKSPIVDYLVRLAQVWSDLNEGQKDGYAAYIERSNAFEGLCTAIILINTVYISVSMERSLSTKK